MKTISTLLASLILSISIFASDRPSGSLFVLSNKQGDVKVILDGMRFESQDNSIMIPNVNKGNHDVKIFRERNAADFGMFARKYELVYDGTVFVKPGRQVSITIDRYGRAVIDEQKIRGNRGRDRDDYDHDFDRNYNDGDRDGNYRNDDRSSDFRNSRAISSRELDYVLQSIQKEWFESNRMESARQIINTNYFTSDQVKQMLQLFSFDNNKLELAKLAYKKTVDPRNYQCVFDELSFSSSKAELSRYIQSCR